MRKAQIQLRRELIRRQLGDLIAYQLALADSLLGNLQQSLRAQDAIVGSVNLQQNLSARGDDILFLSLRVQRRALHELVCASKIRKQLVDLKALSKLGKNPRIVQNAGADTIRIISFRARD